MRIVTELPINGMNWQFEDRTIEGMIFQLNSLLNNGFVPRERPRRRRGSARQASTSTSIG